MLSPSSRNERMAWHQLSIEASRLVPCQHCGADRYALCVTPSGKHYSHGHNVRRAVAVGYVRALHALCKAAG